MGEHFSRERETAQLASSGHVKKCVSSPQTFLQPSFRHDQRARLLGAGTSPVSGCALSHRVFLHLPDNVNKRARSTACSTRLPSQPILSFLSPLASLMSCLLSSSTVRQTASFLLNCRSTRKRGQRGRL